MLSYINPRNINDDWEENIEHMQTINKKIKHEIFFHDSQKLS